MTVSLSLLKKDISEGVTFMKGLIIRELAKLIEKLEDALLGIQGGRSCRWHFHHSKYTDLKKTIDKYDVTCILEKIGKIELEWRLKNKNIQYC